MHGGNGIPTSSASIRHLAQPGSGEHLRGHAQPTACDQIQRQVLGEPGRQGCQAEASRPSAAPAAIRARHRGLLRDLLLQQKAAIFAGWQEMDARYMRTNKIEEVELQLPPPEPPSARRPAKTEPAAEKNDKAENRPAKATRLRRKPRNPASKQNRPTAPRRVYGLRRRLV